MPSSFFGTGTRCLAKTQAQRRVGLCAGCGRESWLVSYDGALWATLFYLPLMPLGRKRVFDECQNCGHAEMVDIAEWNKAAHLDISNAKAHFEASPSVDNALRYHQCLLDYHQHEDADKLGANLQQWYGQEAAFHAHMGKVLSRSGDEQAATTAFSRAFALNPDLQAAREGMARSKIREGNLKGAVGLLAHLEGPGAGAKNDLSVLEELAHRYQGLGLHEEALKTFQTIVREQPSRAQSKGFRDAVQVSERAQKVPATMLPPIKHRVRWVATHYRKPLAATAIVLVTAAGALTYRMLSVRTQTLHVVNGFLTPVAMHIDDGPVERIANGPTELVLREGSHVAHFTGLVNEDVPFTLRSSLWSKPVTPPVNVLNVGGHAVLRKQVSGADERVEFITGGRFVVLSGVDEAFDMGPVNPQQRAVAPVELDYFEGTAVDVVGYFVAKNQIERALTFCEQALEADGECDDAAELYAQIAAGKQYQERAMGFLKARLGKRPVQIALHRAWQDIRRVSGNAAVLEEYRALSAKEPGNGALVYLQGRLEDAETGAGLFQRSTELDRKLAWGWFAQGVTCSTEGRWREAVPLYEKAVVLRPANRRFAQKRDEALIGDGRWSQIKRDAQALLKVRPNHYAATVALIEAHAAMEHPEEAESMAVAYVRNNASEGIKRADLDAVMLLANYACGHFQAMLDHAGNSDALVNQRARFQAKVELGDVAGAVKEKVLATGNPLFLDALAASVAWKLAGDEAAAANWEQLGINSLRRSGDAAQALLATLTATSPPDPRTMHFNGLEAQDQALVFAWFALKFPEAKASYADLAKRFNIRRAFPYHLVKKIVGQ